MITQNQLVAAFVAIYKHYPTQEEFRVFLYNLLDTLQHSLAPGGSNG